MRKKFQSIMAALVLSIGFGAVALVPVSYAEPKPATVAAGCTDASSCVNDGLQATGGTSSKTNINDIIKTVVNVLLFIIASISVIMIIIGGIKYTISQGDSSAITTAKNTILYAVIGLMVAIFAYAIVNFVVSHFI